VTKSSNEPQDVSTAVGAVTSAASEMPKKFWEFADLGFDTAKKLWFIQFYNETNENVGTYFANDVTLDRGKGVQYQWKDAQGRPFWHVRERFFASDIASFSIDPAGGKITLTFGREDDKEDRAGVPPEFSYLLYAYHLSSKDGGRAPMGFIEFYDPSGALLRRLENRWIIIEGLRRKTVGEFPKIRMRAESRDVGTILVTQTAVVVQGKAAEA
jgi:hypothetical protein